MRTTTWALAIPPLAAAALLLWACGGGAAPPAATGDEAAPHGILSRPAAAALAFPLEPGTPTALDRVRAFPALRFARPVFVTTAPDGTDRLFVVEQAGRILTFADDDAASSPASFLDISARVSRAGNEEGLLGLAFDPDYRTSGAFYVHYSAAGPRRSVISRFRVGPSADDADEESEEILLTIPQPYDNHNGGWLGFGPDGMLYVALGDGGSGGDPAGNGQNLGTLLGSILRIDPRRGSPYAIPSDNPFVGVPGARGEIFAYGVRNAWRCSFDRSTGELWAGDVGQGAREEVDVVPRGANLGWNRMEGNLEYANPTGLPPSAYVPPVADYPRSAGTTVIGGYVCRGPSLPSIRGAYLYGDYGTGRVWALVRQGGAVRSNAEVASVPDLVSFGEDSAGDLLAVSLTGELWRFREHAPSASPPFPVRLSETGLFSDTAALVPATGLIPYDVNAPLWSDGAAKRRWIALPGSARIEFAATGPWEFPVGTVLVKHFELAVSPTTTRRLETRVLVHEEGGWGGVTYRWNAAGTDADLLPGAATDVVDVADPAAPGGVRRVSWRYPSRSECLQCHTAAAGRVLGVRTLQMNRTFSYAGVTDGQIRAWNHVGLFTTDVGGGALYGAMPDPAGSAPVRERSRSYLAANCAQCHLPGGPTPVDVDLRYEVPLSATRTVGVRPTSGGLGIPDAWRVLAGAKESSVLWERMRRLDASRMPPLASHVVDAEGVLLVGRWIDEGP